jgi:hypothetical protein
MESLSMPKLSPAAQAVDDAFWKIINDKWNIYDRRRAQIAAALRAAVDQVLPTEMDLPPIAPDLGHFRQHERRLTRQRLLAIADELEAQ